jgi:CBS domain-containing protein
MTSPAVICHLDDTLNAAAKLMWDHDCGAIPVVGDDGKLAGIVTDRDICMAAYTQGRPLGAILINSVMSEHVVSAHRADKLGAIEQQMMDHQIRRIPVVDDDDKPIGMITLNDLALESAQPDTRIKNAATKIAHTLAAVCHPRTQRHQRAA